ncbi:MAG: squalene synthase HpnC [Pirellula sp.]|nr:squalene synthase HpnC [Pirellula sp.]
MDAELPIYGPAGSAAPPSLNDAEAYCRHLATTHYENFVVAGVLVPRRLRRHFYNVYAYCRWSDDLADEAGSAERSLQLLEWWGTELRECYAGRCRHPVFVALRGTIEQFGIPIEPFADLLTAFRQDQTQTRYGSYDELLGYCRNSANPVGRLVLYMARCREERFLPWSDAICTGLQLANSWQDVSRDLLKGRVYLPHEDRERFGVDEAALDQTSTPRNLRDLIAFEVDRAEQLLRSGLPLVDAVPRGLQGSIWMFAHGGLKILEKIRAIDYDVLAMRPRVTKVDQLRLLAGCLWRNAWRGEALR